MAIPQNVVDVIAYDIRVQGRQAIEELKAITTSSLTAQEQVQALARVMSSVAAGLGGDFKAAAAAMRELASIKVDVLKDDKMVSQPLIDPQILKQATIMSREQSQQELDIRKKITAEVEKMAAIQKSNAIDPSKIIPKFVTSQYGDINKYIEQSKDKVAAWSEVVKKSATTAGVSFEKAGAELKKMVSGTTVAPLNTALQKLGEDGRSSFKKLLDGMHAARIALGALTSMLVFGVIQALGNMIREAVKGLTEIESAMFNIANAEEKLSKMGVDVTPTGLEKMIEDLQILDPMLSKFQATELVSVIASKVAPAMRLTEKEMGALAKTITILAVRNQALGKSFEEVEQQVITGLLSGRVTSGINQLGAKITEQAVQEEVLRMGLVETEEAYKSLNAQTKERIDLLAIVSLLERDQAVEQKNLPKFMQTASGLMGVAKKEFSDLLTTVGQTLAPLIKSVLRIIIDWLRKANEWLEKNKKTLTSLSALFGFILEGVENFELLEKFVKATFFAMNLINLAFEKFFLILSKIIEKIPPLKNFLSTFFEKITGKTSLADTPTSPFNPDDMTADEEKLKEHGEKLAEIMQDNADKLVDIERQYKEKIEDINRDYSEKLIDIARETAQKREDAERDYNQKVEDINRDAAEKIAEAQIDFRQKEIDREAEYQRKLRELREKFLFDLEDALRERDARQVLRLIRQYQMDKKSLEDKRKLDAEEAKKDLAQKLAEIERERLLKLEEAKREYAEKLEEIAIGEKRALSEARIWLSRQLAEARLWHQRQLAEQREYLKRKLEDLRRAYEQELKMAQAYGSAINGALVQSNPLSGAVTNTDSSYGSNDYGTNTGIGSGLFNPYDIRSRMAEGGTIIARKPTVALFGERGAEAATFKPIGRSGTDVNKVFGDINASGSGGFINIAMSLSPDLEARVVETSLENVAVHLERMVRTG